MKKIFAIFIICFFSFFLYSKSDKQSITVSNITDNYTNHYELIYKDELLNLRNFKLKLAPLFSYEYNITKIYINYSEKIKDYFNDKEYFSFDNSNINIGLDRLKNEYKQVLKNNYLYDELESDINEVEISKIQVYVSYDAIKKIKHKYPKVIVRVLDTY